MLIKPKCQQTILYVDHMHIQTISHNRFVSSKLIFVLTNCAVIIKSFLQCLIDHHFNEKKFTLGATCFDIKIFTDICDWQSQLF